MLTPRQSKPLDHTHGSASSGAKACNTMALLACRIMSNQKSALSGVCPPPPIDMTDSPSVASTMVQDDTNTLLSAQLCPPLPHRGIPLLLVVLTYQSLLSFTPTPTATTGCSILANPPLEEGKKISQGLSGALECSGDRGSWLVARVDG
jgi:hypothetical protein